MRPPSFVVAANEALVKNLTDLVFKPHRSEVRFTPAKAAVLLRSLVLGATHPGMWMTARQLSAKDIADALPHGIAADRNDVEIEGR